MRPSRSSTPRTDSLCALHAEMARRDRVEVITTFPDESAEYSRSLSSDQARAVTGDEWDLNRCNGLGGCSIAPGRFFR